MDTVVDYLTSKGADINAKDNRGWTAFMNAYHNEPSVNPRLEFLDHLIKKGADVNAANKDGLTLLDSDKPDSELAQFLRRNGGKSKAELANQTLVSYNLFIYFSLYRLRTCFKMPSLSSSTCCFKTVSCFNSSDSVSPN